uniref:Ras association domain family member 1 n=1 Tax=Oryzias sinensis TaxID=183150 RepID=A0A8C8DQE5_9TELE
MSWGEFIELRDLRSREQLELTGTRSPCSPPRLERTNALRISPGRVPDLLSRVGEGHNFQPCSHAQPTWCDLCGDFIWGLYKQSLQCVSELASGTFVCLCDEQTERGKQELSSAEIQQKVKEYNAQINSNLFMNMNKDGSYTGFIKVQFKLARPVSVPAPKKGSQDACGRRASGVKRRTSFYLPKDASKYLHISSRTSAREVIEALLKKFTVVDNPGKFALFERSERHDQVYIRKLSDEERPLRLRLCSGPSEKVLSFVLKENETGEVNWHAFSMPELKNFLLILQREEEEHVKQIIQRYALARTKMRDALAGSTPG